MSSALKITAAILFGSAFALAAAEPAPVEVPLGMEGTFYLRAESPHLEAKPVDEQSPLTVRIASVTRDRGAWLYELRFIGLRAGLQDLRGYLRRPDGGEPATLGPLPVLVKESLPPDHQGALESYAGPVPARPWPLRPWIWTAAALWAIPLLWSCGRWLRRPARRPAAVMSRPTLDGEIRPLVDAALREEISPGEKARLERLLLALWRSRLKLAGADPREALRRLREDGEAADLLERLEGWLHRRPGNGASAPGEFLERYASVSSGEAPQ